MRLPNGEHAVVDLVKLTDYCLNPEHPRGRHKARVFESALGIRIEDASRLRQLLMDAARTAEANAGLVDDFGQRFTIDFQVRSEAGSRVIRCHWIVRTGEFIPRLTTCFVL